MREEKRSVLQSRGRGAGGEEPCEVSTGGLAEAITDNRSSWRQKSNSSLGTYIYGR